MIRRDEKGGQSLASDYGDCTRLSSDPYLMNSHTRVAAVSGSPCSNHDQSLTNRFEPPERVDIARLVRGKSPPFDVRHRLRGVMGIREPKTFATINLDPRFRKHDAHASLRIRNNLLLQS